MEILERLDSLKLSEDDLLTLSQVAEVLGVTARRVRVLAKPKNPVTRSRLNAQLNQLHKAYEVRVGDLREFIVNDYVHAKSGRPKRKPVEQQQEEERDRV
jgi:hypothetical protein